MVLMPKKKISTEKPSVHEHLQGFDIKISAFGEIISSYNVEKLNTFLNENVTDKKLKDQKAQEEEE